MITPHLPPWPCFEQDEIDAVVDVLKSGKINYWTGDKIKTFERMFAEYHGMKHAIALANGTLTLELALRGYGIGAGDEVITTARTFIASASCIVQVGAIPVIADVDLDSQNISPETIAAVITPKTKAIVVVHLAGWPADMPGIMSLAKKHNLAVIEDCAQAHGAKINGKLVGSFGQMSSFSFCQDKIMSTGGEGGMLLLNDTEIYEKIWAFKDHGKSYDAVFRRQHPEGFRWLCETFGTNYRLTEMQAAIGILQLQKLEGWVSQRNYLAKSIIQGVRDLKSLRIPEATPEIYHAFYKLYFFIRPEILKPGWTRDRIMKEVTARGIPLMSGSCGEIYLEKAFVNAGYGPKDRLPQAKQLAETSLMLMVHHTLGDDYVQKSVAALRSVLLEAEA